MASDKNVRVKLKIVERFEVTLVGPDESRRPRPEPNQEARAALTALMREPNKATCIPWWHAWFSYLSKKQVDRDNMRDLILSKLPVAKLFAVGCVPAYRERMFNAHLNPYLQGHLFHKKEYFLSSFCTREREQKEVVSKVKKESDVKIDPAVKQGSDAAKQETKQEPKKDVKQEAGKQQGESLDATVELEYITLPETDFILEGIDLQDMYVQIELLEGDSYVKIGSLKVRGENDKYQQLQPKPYVQLELQTNPGDIKFATVILGIRVINLADLLRQVQAYHSAQKKWVKMPSLNFLPPKVNRILAGEGGLLLLCGDIRPYVDPLAVKPVEEKPVEEIKPAIDEHADGKSPEGKPIEEKPADGKPVEKKPSVKTPAGKEVSIKPPVERKTSIKQPAGKKVSIKKPDEEEAEEEKPVEEKPADEKPGKPADVKPAEKKQPPPGPLFPPQHLLVVCNPIAKTFRILPPTHCNLENPVAHMLVSSMSTSYIIYLVGLHRPFKECPESEGLRVAIYNSLKQKWRMFSVPSGKLFRPGQTSYGRALPLITRLFEGPTLFLGGELATQKAGIYAPAILGYRLATRTWKAYNWPPASAVESPQVVECNHQLYIVARGASEPATINIWRFIPHLYEVPDCHQVTKMPQKLLSSCFIPGFRKSEFDCVSSMDCISFLNRDKATVITSYNVKTNKWNQIQKNPGFIAKETILANWLYEPTTHAQV